MINGVDGIYTKSMQALRIQEHPVPICEDEDLIIVDNLEAGKLRIYEYIGGPLNIQQLLWNNKYKNAALVAEVDINNAWGEKGIFIHKVFCEHGHEENLIEPMINQIMHFFEYYECYELIGISDNTYENCFPYAKEILGDFQKSNRIYVSYKK